MIDTFYHFLLGGSATIVGLFFATRIRDSIAKKYDCSNEKSKWIFRCSLAVIFFSYGLLFLLLTKPNNELQSIASLSKEPIRKLSNEQSQSESYRAFIHDKIAPMIIKYYREHHEMPDKFDMVTSEKFDKQFIYKRTGENSFSIHSYGPNNIDDCGQKDDIRIEYTYGGFNNQKGLP